MLLQFHDTYGTAISNVLTSLQHGLRTFDSSIAGLGGCPYSPGATGNVATEDVIYALQGEGYKVLGDPKLGDVAEVGAWISEKLGRESVSRAGKAYRAKVLREKEVKAKL